MECQYQILYEYYDETCINKKYQSQCEIYKTLENLLKFEVFKSKINKRIYLSEHCHHQNEYFRV